MKPREIKFTVNACRWFDKVNGNTYNSTRITRTKDGKVIVTPFQYGYGEYYKQAALEAMEKAGWLPKKYIGQEPNGMKHCYNYERENNYPILWNVSDGLKRDCVANGTL